MDTKKIKITRWIVGLLIIALLAAGAFGIAWAVRDPLAFDETTFYLVYAGKQIRQTDNVALFFYKGSHYKFETRFPAGEEANPNYELKVVPNAAADFTFSVDDEEKKWSWEGEVTAAFDITKDKEGFTLTLPSDFSLLGVLQEYYKGKDIQFLDMRGQKTIAYYKIMLSVGREYLFEIVFSVDDISIKIDKGRIEF